MKTAKKYSILAIAAIFFAGCSSKNDLPVPSKEKTAKLEIKLAGIPANLSNSKAANQLKSTGTLPTQEKENEISKVTVGVFNSNGDVNVIKEFSSEEVNTKKGTILCSPGENVYVIVVANAPEKHFAGVTKQSDFIGRTITLDGTLTGNNQLGDKLPMSGSAIVTKLTGGSSTSATVSISRLVARISVNSIKAAFDANGQYNKASFTLTKVFLHNANSTSTVAPGTNSGSLPISGQTENTYLGNVVSQEITNVPHTAYYWFYTFANNSSSTPTRLVLQGQFDPDGSGGPLQGTTVYYPITINKKQTGTLISGGNGDGTATGNIDANSTYTITATIKGKGSSSPDIEIIPATLDLTVEVKNWALNITQNVTFE